jgi:hypothetical protein
MTTIRSDGNLLVGSLPLFNDDGVLDLGGAMILMDEAHTMFENSIDDENTKTDAQLVLEVLKTHASKLHTLGLFTATPFVTGDSTEDILLYETLLNKGKDSEYLLQNHMFLFDSAMSKESPGMFNKESWDYQMVDASPILRKMIEIGPESYKTTVRKEHCWVTTMDIPVIEDRIDWSPEWNKAYRDFAMTLSRELAGVRKWTYKDIQAMSPVITEEVATWLHTMFQGPVDEQTKLVTQLDLGYNQETHQFKKNEKSFVILGLLYPKLSPMLCTFLQKNSERERGIQFYDKLLIRDWATVNKSLLREEARNISRIIQGDVEKHGHEKGKWINSSLTKLLEDRSVLMLDLDHGLGILGRILVHQNITHVISQAALMESAYFLPVEENQYFLSVSKEFYNGDKLRSDCDKLEKISLHRYVDTGITNLYNNHPRDIPVMIYNSIYPEGVDLFHTTNMYVIPSESEFSQLDQMVGRINRLCHTTSQDKKITFYTDTVARQKEIEVYREKPAPSHVRKSDVDESKF